jgi:hypothetical protein
VNSRVRKKYLVDLPVGQAQALVEIFLEAGSDSFGKVAVLGCERFGIGATRRAGGVLTYDTGDFDRVDLDQ